MRPKSAQTCRPVGDSRWPTECICAPVRLSSRRVSLGIRLNGGVAWLAALVIAVLVLAFFQYRWINELSEAQDARARTRVRDLAATLAAAFDTEVTRSVLTFDARLADLFAGRDPIE